MSSYLISQVIPYSSGLSILNAVLSALEKIIKVHTDQLENTVVMMK